MVFLLDVRKNPPLRTAAEVFCPKEAGFNLLIRNHSKINTILSTNTIKRKITRIRAILVEDRVGKLKIIGKELTDVNS
jgi:hypothetical protein